MDWSLMHDICCVLRCVAALECCVVVRCVFLLLCLCVLLCLFVCVGMCESRDGLVVE
jgi:hypothetical protein